ncbi:MAG: hypothetical protein ACK2UK_06400 [Candidatus Promineifilaceae bacterium]
MDGGKDGNGKDAPGAAAARIVHRTRERARLRVPGRRRDLDYFLALYEDLRAHPEFDEVRINPVTGSVVLAFAAGHAPHLETILAGCPLLTLVPERQRDAAAPDGHPHDFHSGINDMRMLIFVIMLALSVQQLLKGQLLVPILTMLLYVADLAAGLRLEQDAAVQSHPETADRNA